MKGYLMALICENCGERNDDGDIRCCECGAALADRSQQATDSRFVEEHDDHELLNDRRVDAGVVLPEDIALPEDNDGLDLKNVSEDSSQQIADSCRVNKKEFQSNSSTASPSIGDSAVGGDVIIPDSDIESNAPYSEQEQQDVFEGPETQPLSPEKIANTDELEEPATSAQCQESDCRDFKIRWNQGASLFIAGVGSSLEFELTPISSVNATNFKMFLKFPGNTSYTEQKLNFLSVSRPMNVVVNYRPDENLTGVNQAVELYFSYEQDNQRRFGDW